MKTSILILLILCIFISCNNKDKKGSTQEPKTKVQNDSILDDKIVKKRQKLGYKPNLFGFLQELTPLSHI